MAGPNLELFKFGLYLFFPLAIMVHYGDPEWYHRNVLPIRDQFWPKEESLYRPPRTSEDLQVALEEMKRKRLDRRQARIEQEQGHITNQNSYDQQQGSKTPQPVTRGALHDIKTDSAFTKFGNERLV